MRICAAIMPRKMWRTYAGRCRLFLAHPGWKTACPRAAGQHHPDQGPRTSSLQRHRARNAAQPAEIVAGRRRAAPAASDPAARRKSRPGQDGHALTPRISRSRRLARPSHRDGPTIFRRAHPPTRQNVRGPARRAVQQHDRPSTAEDVEFISPGWRRTLPQMSIRFIFAPSFVGRIPDRSGRS